MKNNEIVIRGKVSRDPKYGQGQKSAYCFLTVVTGSGKFAAYHAVSGFQENAEILKNLRKGDEVEITGNLQYRKRTVKGETVYEASITAETVISPEASTEKYQEVTDDDIPF